MPGGFAGVDVFFVISGFLMTGIIFRGIEQDNFSILKFYVARANRIIPALAVLCLVLLVFGWFYLTPLDYRALGKHVGSSMGFLSNIIYWRESGYFDAASHEKWLLHTWSLSAEWQFYIIYPLVLVAMRKFMSLKAMKATVLVGTVLGFIFCVIATYKWPNPAYYLLPTRAWEMMIGGVAYLYPLKLAENRKKVFEWAGLALIILSYIFISKENLWPGYLALIPVLGAFLLIQAQRNDSIVTGNIIFQSLGKWSYSIYLWHWPLVVAIYSFSLNENFIYLGVFLSIILGFISNKYVESVKFRNDFYTIRQYCQCKPIIIMLSIGFLGCLTYLSDGFIFHYDKSVVIAQSYAKDQNPRKKECFLPASLEGISPLCQYGEGKVKAVLIGDSHSDAIINSLMESYEGVGSVVQASSSGCPTLNVAERNGYTCHEFMEKTIKKLPTLFPQAKFYILNRYSVYPFGYTEENKERKPLINYNGSFDIKKYSDDFTLSLCEMARKNQVTVILPIPEYPRNVPDELAMSILLHDDAKEVKIKKEDYLKRNKIFFSLINKTKEKCNIKTIDPTIALCDDNFCYANNGYNSYYYDDDHLSQYGASLLIPIFKESLSSIQ